MSPWLREDPFEKAMRVLKAAKDARRQQMEKAAEMVAEEVESLKRLTHRGH